MTGGQECGDGIFQMGDFDWHGPCSHTDLTPLAHPLHMVSKSGEIRGARMLRDAPLLYPIWLVSQ